MTTCLSAATCVSRGLTFGNTSGITGEKSAVSLFDIVLRFQRESLIAL
jgi:hypothetical protein